jgi:hypothetical protein
MTDQEWNPNDYLFEFDDIPRYEGEMVLMPIHHKIEKVRHYLIDEVLGEMEKCLAVGAELAGVLLGLAAVDYLAGFYVGKQSQRKDYIAFMRRFFPHKYHPFLEDIYDQFRSGLMHNLVATNPWKPRSNSFLIHPSSDDHLERNSEGRVVFSVGHFRIDIFRAWRMHAHGLIMKPLESDELIANFNKRFNKLDGIGAFMVRVPDA